jgi:hypothetical protein
MVFQAPTNHERSDKADAWNAAVGASFQRMKNAVQTPALIHAS